MQGRARIGTSYWIHWLARGRYGNRIHLPLSFYELYTVYICMSGLSRHRKANKHFDNSLSPAYVPTTFILKCMCSMRPFLSPTYLSKECIWIKNVLTSFWDGWKITILEQQNVKKKSFCLSHWIQEEKPDCDGIRTSDALSIHHTLASRAFCAFRCGWVFLATTECDGNGRTRTRGKIFEVGGDRT